MMMFYSIIFDYLNIGDKMAAMRVCSQWRAIIKLMVKKLGIVGDYDYTYNYFLRGNTCDDGGHLLRRNRIL